MNCEGARQAAVGRVSRTNQKLVAARLERGWTQNQLATAAHEAAADRGLPEPGIDANQVSRWERGSKPHLYYAHLLCLAFGRSPYELGLPLDSMPSRVRSETGEGLVRTEGDRSRNPGPVAASVDTSQRLDMRLRLAAVHEDPVRRRGRRTLAAIRLLHAVVVPHSFLDSSHARPVRRLP